MSAITPSNFQGDNVMFPKLACTVAALLVIPPGFLFAAAADRYGRNYDEAKVGAYTVPDPLVCSDGSRVTDVETWQSRRRPEILKAFRDLMYGHTPEFPIELRAKTLATRNDAVDGLATRTVIELSFFDDADAPKIQLMLYVPNAAKEPVPAFLGPSFYGNASVEADSTIPLPHCWLRSSESLGIVNNRATEATRGKSASRWPLELPLKRGYAVATFCYCDVEPDHIDGWKDGIRGYALKRAGRTARAADEWGALGAWAWGLSRALDYLETVPTVDARRVVVFGHSRLGKTALWATAQDERFAIAISNNSGEGGASLARRNFGENIAYSMAHASWRYCERFRDYIDRADALPFDQHMLLGLIAPRPVYVASATEDGLADPRGEFVSAMHAESIYRLFGLRGVNTTEWPSPDHPVGETLGYHLRTGRHDVTAYDWERYLEFADRHLRGGK